LYRRIRALGLGYRFDKQLLSPSEQDDLQAALDQYKQKTSPPDPKTDPLLNGGTI
jgi:hypothetical protein